MTLIGFSEHPVFSISDAAMDVELRDMKTVSTLGMGGFGRVELVKGFDKTYALKVCYLQ